MARLDLVCSKWKSQGDAHTQKHSHIVPIVSTSHKQEIPTEIPIPPVCFYPLSLLYTAILADWDCWIAQTHIPHPRISFGVILYLAFSWLVSHGCTSLSLNSVPRIHKTTLRSQACQFVCMFLFFSPQEYWFLPFMLLYSSVMGLRNKRWKERDKK